MAKNMAKAHADDLKAMGKAQALEDDSLETDIKRKHPAGNHEPKETPAEKAPKDDAKDTRNLIIIMAVIGVVIAVFVIGFILARQQDRPKTVDELHELNLKGLLKEDQGYMYNGYSFVKFADVWYTQVQRNATTYDVTFNYDPRSVENISVNGSLSADFTRSKRLYITFDPESPDLKYIAVANYGLSRSLARGFQYNISAACTKNITSACASAGIVNCGDAGKSVITFMDSNTTEIILNGTCVTIAGNGYEYVRAKDRLLLRWYGIKEN